MGTVLGLGQGEAECLHNLSASWTFSDVYTVTEHMDHALLGMLTRRKGMEFIHKGRLTLARRMSNH